MWKIYHSYNGEHFKWLNRFLWFKQAHIKKGPRDGKWFYSLFFLHTTTTLQQERCPNRSLCSSRPSDPASSTCQANGWMPCWIRKRWVIHEKQQHTDDLCNTASCPKMSFWRWLAPLAAIQQTRHPQRRSIAAGRVKHPSPCSPILCSFMVPTESWTCWKWTLNGAWQLDCKMDKR